MRPAGPMRGHFVSGSVMISAGKRFQSHLVFMKLRRVSFQAGSDNMSDSGHDETRSRSGPTLSRLPPAQEREAQHPYETDRQATL